MRGGKRLEIVEFHVVAAGIVIAADEPGVGGNVDAALAQAIAHFGPVGHGGEEPRVGAAAASAAGAAIVGRFVRVVQAGRSVAQDHHQAGEAAASSRPGPKRWPLVLSFPRLRIPSTDRSRRLAIAPCSASASVPCAAREGTPCSATRAVGRSAWAPADGRSGEPPKAIRARLVESQPRSSVLR